MLISYFSPYNFPYAGSVYGSALNGVGSYGVYWSRTAGSNTVAYNLFVNSSYVNPAYGTGRYRGFPIRCVATT